MNISRRDYFAGLAMQSLIAKLPLLDCQKEYGESCEHDKVKEVRNGVAESARAYADEMILALEPMNSVMKLLNPEMKSEAKELINFDGLDSFTAFQDGVFTVTLPPQHKIMVAKEFDKDGKPIFIDFAINMVLFVAHHDIMLKKGEKVKVVPIYQHGGMRHG